MKASLATLLLSGLLFFSAPRAESAIMVSNLSHTPSASDNVDTGTWLASSFTTDNSSATFFLENVVLDMDSVLDNSGNFFVRIYTDSSGPATQVAPLSGTATPAVGLNTYMAPLNTVLTANTTYWVVAGVSSGDGKYQWFTDPSPPTTDTWTIPNQSAGSTDLGSSWLVAAVPPNLFSVSATVPEPGSCLLLGMALVLLMAPRGGFRLAVIRTSV